MADDKTGDLDSVYQSIVNQQPTPEKPDFGTTTVTGTRLVTDSQNVFGTVTVQKSYKPQILNEDED